MSESYTSLAPVYDLLNGDIDYAVWGDFIEKQFELFAVKTPESVLDLACGTGTMTVELAGRGYDMTGIDLSEDMLAVARKKCDEGHFRHDVLLLCQNMTDFELYGTVDAVVCCLDGLNYLTKTEMLKKTFRHVHNYLNPDGLFLFDMNTPTKFREVYGTNAYILEEEGVFLAWQNIYNNRSKLCEFYLTIFKEDEKGRWHRTDEEQRERCYSLATVKKALSECGFELCGVFSDYDMTEADKDTERWYFAARAKK